MKWLLLLVLLPACNCQPGNGPDGGGGGQGGSGGSGGGTEPTGRCDTDLERFKTGNAGTLKLLPITDNAQLIGGPTAYGKIGDYLFQNEKIRVIVQGFDRHIGAQPFGGTILDADFVRPAGEPGQDQFGEMGLLYNFGRTLDPDKFEILSDGSDGKSVVLAVTGLDAANDYLSIRNQLRNMVGQLPVTDPYAPVTLKMTSYFILNPNEQRLRFVTAFCNTSPSKEVVLAVGDLTDPGYVLEFFNPQACTAGFGSGGLCFGLDRMNWFGYQGNGIAYGYSPYKAGSPLQPEPQNASLTIAGITGLDRRSRRPQRPSHLIRREQVELAGRAAAARRRQRCLRAGFRDRQRPGRREQPTTDNWLVAMIYGSKSLFPLNFNAPGSSGALAAIAPFALTNPVFIDANGGGFDKPPFKPAGNARRVAPPEPELVPPSSIEEMVQRWGAFVESH